MIDGLIKLGLSCIIVYIIYKNGVFNYIYRVLSFLGNKLKIFKKEDTENKELNKKKYKYIKSLLKESSINDEI